MFLKNQLSSVYKRVEDVDWLPAIVFAIAAALLLFSFGLSRHHASEPSTQAEDNSPKTAGSGDHAKNAALPSLTSEPDARSPALDVLQQQLAQERERSADLGRQLNGAHQNADAAGNVSAKLQTEKAKTAALGAQVADLQRKDAEADSLRKQVEAERARATDLDAKLRGLQAAKDTLGSQLLAQQRDATLVAKELAAAKQTASQARDVQAQLDTERTRTASLEKDVAAAHDQAASLAAAKSDEDDRLQALTQEVTAGKRSGGQVADLLKQLAVEQAQVADLNQTLSSERAKAADADAKLRAAQAQVATLQESSAHSLPADMAAALSKDLDTERSRAMRLETDLAQVREEAQRSSGTAAALQAEQQSRKQTADQLAAAQVLADQAGSLRKKLQDEQIVSSDLRRELSQSQANEAVGRRAEAELKNGGSQLAALVRDLETARAEAARSGDLDGKLQAEMKRSAALDADLKIAQQTAGQVTGLQKQLADEQGHAAALGRDLDAARKEMARSGDLDGKLQAEMKRSVAINTDQRKLQGEIEVLQTRSAEQQSRLAVADRDLAASRAESAANQAKLRDEQGQSASLRQKLATANDVEGSLRSLQAQIATEQQRSAALVSDLQQARGTIVHMTETEARLHDAEGRSAELSARLASAQQTANAFQEAQGELAAERARIADLTQTLAATRDKLAAATDLGAQLKDEQTRSADLKQKLDQAQRTAGEFDALQRRLAGRLTFDLAIPGQLFTQDEIRHLSFPLDGALKPGTAGKPTTSEPSRTLAATAPNETGRNGISPTGVEGKQNKAVVGSPSTDTPQPNVTRPASATQNPPQPVRPDTTVSATPLAAQESQPAAQASDNPQIGDRVLQRKAPEDTLAWVVLRFPQSSRAAQTKAADVGAVLKASGWGVRESIADKNNFGKNQVVYYYVEDQTRARRIAGLVNITKIAQGRIPSQGPLPRPGTVEVAVAGNQ